MKIPNIFVPEKDLEKKTENLLQENKKTPKPIIIEKKELEDLLYTFNEYYFDNALHEKIGVLIRKSDYQSLKVKDLKWEYWTKKTDYDENYVFTKWHDRKNTRYALAIVNDGKLEEFCERIERDTRVKLFGLGRDRLYYLMASSFIGSAFIGLATKYAASSYMLRVFNNLNEATTVSCMAFLGAILGFIEGTLWLTYKNSVNKKKLKTCYTQLITDDKTAIKMAFS